MPKWPTRRSVLRTFEYEETHDGTIQDDVPHLRHHLLNALSGRSPHTRTIPLVLIRMGVLLEVPHGRQRPCQEDLGVLPAGRLHAQQIQGRFDRQEKR